MPLEVWVVGLGCAARGMGCATRGMGCRFGLCH